MISYENSLGRSMRLDADGLLVAEDQLRDFTWDSTYSAYPDASGGVITMFSRHSKTKTFSVLAYGQDSSTVGKKLNALHDLTEYDVHTLSPGKLWLDDQYLSCYIVDSTVEKKSRQRLYVLKRLTVYPVIPYWCNEVTKAVRNDGSGEDATDGKRYIGRYAYKYGTSYSTRVLDNSDSAWDTPVKIVVYGPVMNPIITIGGNNYSLLTTLSANERAIIDQIHKKIYKIGTTGQRTNLYNYRDKTTDIFKPIPPGEQEILFNSNFSFDITLIRQRSEPLWTT